MVSPVAKRKLYLYLAVSDLLDGKEGDVLVGLVSGHDVAMLGRLQHDVVCYLINIDLLV